MTKIFPFLFCVLFSAAVAEERTWTNAEGKTMEAELVSVEGDTVVFSRGSTTYQYPIGNLSEADQVIVRERAEKDRQAEIIAGELRGKLVQANGSRLPKTQEAEIDRKRLFAFYYSAGWCGPCRRFTPELVEFYNQAQANHPEFEVVFVSSDRDADAMEEYMRDEGMKFPAVQFSEKDDLAVAGRYKQRGIPNLVFVDGSGEVISASYLDGKYLGPQKVLRDIREHLAAK